MRRLFRRLFTLAAAASAVLCVGVCGLWVRTYGRESEWTFRPSTGVCYVRSRGGVVTVKRLVLTPPSPPDPSSTALDCTVQRGVPILLRGVELQSDGPAARAGFGFL